MGKNQGETTKDGNQAAGKSPISSPSTKPKNSAHLHDRSPKNKDGEKFRERLNKSKLVWRKESMEKRPRSGPMVAKYSMSKASNLKLDTSIAKPVKGSLRPTSPTYESAFKRQVVNRPVSPRTEGNKAISHARSFNRGRRPPSPNVSAVTPEDLHRKRIQKAKKVKLYLLQQAGPNSFIIGGGDAEDHRHKVTIGAQVESLFRKYEARRKQRLTRAHKPALASSSSMDSDNSSASGDGLSPDNNDASDSQGKMEATCPICLLDLVAETQEPELVQCTHCHNKLHHACMAYWYQLLKRGDALTCPLCRAAWTSVDTASFEKKSGTDNQSSEPSPSPDVYSASPNSLGVSPVSGYSDIEPHTLLPRSQPIPEEHTEKAEPWIQIFGEDLIGCLFMKHEWVVRETALRHLSREIIVFLTSASPVSSPLVEVDGSTPALTRVHDVLRISCQILEMMMQDPVYKVYVSSLRALRTMLSYCTLSDVSELKQYLRPVVKCIIFKCADGNRKTNQLSISTLCEFSKDQDGELALAKELNVSTQQGLGGCLYILWCCVSDTDVENPPIQWLNGHLLTMKELLEQFSERFTTHEADGEDFATIANDILLPIIVFAVQTLARPALPPRTTKYSKRVILYCAKYLSVLHGMNIRVRQLLVNVEPELRARLEKRVMEMAIGAHQEALNSADKSQPHDLSEPRVGSPPPSTEHSQIPKLNKSRHPLFGIIYPAALKSIKPGSRDNEAAVSSRLPRLTAQHKRSNSYTEAIYQEEPDSDSSSMDDDSSLLSSNPTLNSTTDSFLNFSQTSSNLNSSQLLTDFAPTCTAIQNSSLPGTPRSDTDSLHERTTVAVSGQNTETSDNIDPVSIAQAGVSGLGVGVSGLDVVDGHLPTKLAQSDQMEDVVDGRKPVRFTDRPLMMMGASTDSVESVEADNLAVPSYCQPVSEEADHTEQVSADDGKTAELSASNEEHGQFDVTSPHDEEVTSPQLFITSSPNAVTTSEVLLDIVTDDNEADDTLIGGAGVLFSSGESDGEGHGHNDHSPDPKRKIARGRVVSGNKPHVPHRHQQDESDVEEEVDSAFDSVDGNRPNISAGRKVTLSPPHSLHRDVSLGFVIEGGEEVWNAGDGNFQSNYPSDSESGTDNISASVSLDVMTSEDEMENLSEEEFDRRSTSNRLSPNRQLKKASLPFKGYKKHSRSRTDPMRLGREQRASSHSPRYHSDPQAADSSTTSSSTTPRTPPVISSPHFEVQADNLPDSTVASVERPQSRPAASVKAGGSVIRSLTFSEPARREKSGTLRSHHSMRAHKGVVSSQIPRSKHKIIKPSSVVPPMVAEVHGESGAQSLSPTAGQRGADHQEVSRSKSPVTLRSKSSMSGKAVSITAAGAPSKTMGRSSSPVIPSAIRAITPPNSPLKDQSYRRSATPPDSPPPIRDTRPTSSPTPLQQEGTVSSSQSQSVKSKTRRPSSSPNQLNVHMTGNLSRSPSPPCQPVTAVVRPQKGRASTSRDTEPRPSTSSAGMSPPQISVLHTGDMASPSVPVQRQTSSIVGGILATSTSGSSEDRKTGSDSLYVDDLSDSAIASPYEKPVSFKDEVHLFSPRESPAKTGDCHCKDEVELEEAIALAKAMELSEEQSALPHVPGLSARRKEETITIHIQADQTDGNGDEIEYIENIHWRRGMMLGTGAFSTCYQCRDVKTGIIMAVKQISFCRNSESEQDSICNAVIDEIRMMATLDHSNIVRILGATQTGAHFNMFVEWMPGGSVSHLLEKYGAFSAPVITSYTQQVFKGLAYLHDHQILHRDMKGANLLVDSTGKHLRIGDFGACAQLASSMTGAGELKGQLLGTIAFMAPEVLRGEHYGRACDVWSVGCVIIEMVTTKPPWNASNVSNHLKLIFMIASANDSPPIPENLPPAIKDLMLRCLEPDSKNRPPAKELLSHPLFTRSAHMRR